LKSAHLIVLLLLASYANSQHNDDKGGWKAFQLLDSGTHLPVAHAHIILLAKRQGTISNEEGFFRVSIGRADTLIISAVGYRRLKINCVEDIEGAGETQTIYLQPESYAIDSVSIVRYRSYYNFIKDVATREILMSEEEKRVEKLKRNINDVNTDSLIIPQQSPYEVPYLKIASKTFYFGEDWYSKQRKKINRKIKRDQKMQPIYEIISAEGVHRLTGLEGAQAIEFLVFCNFSTKFLEKSTEYEVVKAVLDKYEEYKDTIASQSY
jgi:hypothetical protein